MKFILITVLFVNLLCSANAQTPLQKQNHNVNQALKIVVSDKTMRTAGIGFCAVDIASGEIISEHNQHLALKPASTMKLVTSAAALDILGKDFRFKTVIEYRGTIDTSTNILHGDLIIRGGGDPTLGSEDFSTNPSGFLYTWADKIKALGIDSIDGYIAADARIFSYDMTPPTWSWEDMGNYFGAGACGLTVFDNTYKLYLNTGTKIGDTCKITRMVPEIPELTFDNTVVADNIDSDLSYIFGQSYSYDRYIRGRLPVNQANYEIKGSMPDPALYTAQQFAKILTEQGIGIKQLPTTYRINPTLAHADTLTHVRIHQTVSPPISDIIKKFNFKSINLIGEHLVNYLAYIQFGKGETKKGAGYVEDFWQAKGVDIAGMSLNDGCGLSHYNTVTAKQMCDILRYIHNHGDYETYRASIPTVGQEGTVKSMCKGTAADGNMHAKSGSIRNVRAYSGYVTSASGRVIVFSLMLNNFTCTSSAAREKMETIMVALANFNL